MHSVIEVRVSEGGGARPACRRVCEPFSWELRRFTALPEDAAPADGAPGTPRAPPTPSGRPEAGEEVRCHKPLPYLSDCLYMYVHTCWVVRLIHARVPAVAHWPGQARCLHASCVVNESGSMQQPALQLREH